MLFQRPQVKEDKANRMAATKKRKKWFKSASYCRDMLDPMQGIMSQMRYNLGSKIFLKTRGD